MNDFTDYVVDLHSMKDAAYGDSWKRRGEQMAILANIARKVDRLGVSDSAETSADTAIDLLVYLVKYHWWLWDHLGAEGIGDISESERVMSSMYDLARRGHENNADTDEQLVTWLRQWFDVLELTVRKDPDAPGRLDNPDWTNREGIVEDMILAAYPLAYRLWEEEQK